MSPSDVAIKACEVAAKFSSGEYGREQVHEIAKTLTEDKNAVGIIRVLLEIIHEDGRKLAARSCPFAGRQY